MKLKSLQSLRSNDSLNLARSLSKHPSAIVASVLTLTAAAICHQPEKAAAIDLNFSSPVQSTNINNPLGYNLGPGYDGNVINYLNVAPGVDARITATPFDTDPGTNHSFIGHFPNYSQTSGEPAGDTGAFYTIEDGKTGKGGLTYKIDFFQGGGALSGTFSTAFIAPDLRFLVYDVDGELDQTEAVRVFNSDGFYGYQVGKTPQALIPTQSGGSYLFTGRDVNIPENNADGAAILYFRNTNSVTFQFEADTRSTDPFPEIFSAIDGDLSLINRDTSSFAGFVSTQAPEPFTIIGTIVGGTAALRLRKKLKSTSK